MARVRGQSPIVAAVGGLLVGAAAAGGTWLVRRRYRSGAPDRERDRLETDVVDALCADEVAGSCAIDVAALGPGIIELTGEVPDEEASDRAAAVAGAVEGVHTVVNRLDVAMLERHLDETRRRHEAGDPALAAQGWEGVRSGMGTRRQGPTDPARPDDSQEMREDALGLMDGRRR